MKKLLSSLAVVLMLGAAISPAKAALFSFDYVANATTLSDMSYEAHGTITTGSVLGSALGRTWYSITAISGFTTGVFGGTINGMVSGSVLPPTMLTSPSSLWLYDNALAPDGPTVFALGGVAFTTPGSREWNLWGNSSDESNVSVPGAYTLWSKVVGAQGTYDVQTTGTLTISAIPEPETYAMLLAGLGLMGFVARRRRQAAA